MRSAHSPSATEYHRARLRVCISFAIATLLSLAALPSFAGTPAQHATMKEDSSERLWNLWQKHRFVEDWTPAYRHTDLVQDLEELAARHPELVIEPAGESYEGRSIHRMRLGSGLWRVLLWSQMHGDEPSATPALLDMVNYLLSEPDSPWARSILERLTLDIVPMLNPDGAERRTRRNAQAIDINRDALNLATPEGRLLKELRDRFEPLVGFNLHDQGRRKEVGDTDVLATAAVLAVAADEERTVTGPRRRAMRLSAAIADALDTAYPGGVARYDDSFNERAFGDNISAAGTPVVLLESGGLPPDEPVENLVRLNFVALLHSLYQLALNDATDYTQKQYDQIPWNRNGPWVDVLVRDTELLQHPEGEPYRADLAFNVERSHRATEVDLEEWLREDVRQARSWIREVGDGRGLEGSEEVEVPRHLLIPAFEVLVEGWSARDDMAGPSGDGSGLDVLAKWGVGTVHWEVPAKRLHEAENLIEAWRRDGRPVVLTRAAGSGSPRQLVELPRLPRGEAPNDLRSLAAGLGAEDDTARTRLWRRPANGLPPLRPDAPASFLLLVPASSTDTALERREIAAVWIDGVRAR